MKQVIIFKNDIIKYPPIVSIINILAERGNDILIIGYCSNKKTIDTWKQRNIVYFEAITESVSISPVKKLFLFKQFKKKVLQFVTSHCSEKDQVWIFGTQTIYILKDLTYRYKCILYFFEIPCFNIPKAYRLFCRDKEFKDVIGNEKNKIVCCEYNRAHIVKSYFGLNKLPFIIPNKQYIEAQTSNKNIIASNLRNKKVILYQGIFNYPERKLDDYCEAIKLLPEEYVLILMGEDNRYKEFLRSKYESDRIIFLPFYPTPSHLEITEISYIGILSYKTSATTVDNILNLLYCAPNKIFEYSSYGIPMISNDVPALKQIFEGYHCGIALDTISAKNITNAIMQIERSYSMYKEGAKRFYDSVDIKSSIINMADAI